MEYYYQEKPNMLIIIIIVVIVVGSIIYFLMNNPNKIKLNNDSASDSSAEEEAIQTLKNRPKSEKWKDCRTGDDYGSCPIVYSGDVDTWMNFRYLDENMKRVNNWTKVDKSKKDQLCISCGGRRERVAHILKEDGTYEQIDNTQVCVNSLTTDKNGSVVPKGDTVQICAGAPGANREEGDTLFILIIVIILLIIAGVVTSLLIKQKLS